MADYGSAAIERAADGRLVVLRADDVIGISVELLAQTLVNGLFVGGDGLLWLAGDPQYRYRPVRFDCLMPGLSAEEAAEGTRVVVCERVRTDG